MTASLNDARSGLISGRSATADLPPIPARVRRDEGVVDLAGHVWTFLTPAGEAMNIHWSALDQPKGGGPVFSPRARHLLRLYIAERAAKRLSSGHLKSGIFRAFVHFQSRLLQNPSWIADGEDFDWADYTSETARKLLRLDMRTNSRGRHANHIRAFYRWGVTNRLPGFSNQVYRSLRRMVYPGSLTGLAVRMRCPARGAFDDSELQAISDAIRERKVPEKYCLPAFIFHVTGARPIALALLKNRHLERFEAAGQVVYTLHVPRVKKRAMRRGETKPWAIPVDLGRRLEGQMKGGPDERLLEHLQGLKGPVASVQGGLKRFVRYANIRSHRLPPTPANLARGEAHPLLPIFGYRFRRTLATRMAANGSDPAFIAEVLDDETLGMARLYSQVSNGTATAATKALDGSAFGQYVRLFLGEVMEPGEYARDQDLREIPPAITHLPGDDTAAGPNFLAGIGKCRKKTPCGLSIVAACYRCVKLKANDDPAVHEKVLVQIDSYVRNIRGTVADRVVNSLVPTRAAVLEAIDDCHKQAAKRRAQEAGQ